MMTFLELNGIKLDCTDEDIVETGLALASSNMTYEELLDWIIEHEQ